MVSNYEIEYFWNNVLASARQLGMDEDAAIAEAERQLAARIRLFGYERRGQPDLVVAKSRRNEVDHEHTR